MSATTFGIYSEMEFFEEFVGWEQDSKIKELINWTFEKYLNNYHYNNW